MPLLSMFLGILVRMNWKDVGQHNMPHIHAEYSGCKASFDFDGEMLSGEFPPKQRAFVKAWVLMHRDELEANWKLAVNGEEVFKIDPLK